MVACGYQHIAVAKEDYLLDWFGATQQISKVHFWVCLGGWRRHDLGDLYQREVFSGAITSL